MLAKERQWLPVVHGKILESITTEAEDDVPTTDPWRSVMLRVNRIGRLDLVTYVGCRPHREKIMCDGIDNTIARFCPAIVLKHFVSEICSLCFGSVMKDRENWGEILKQKL